MAPQDDLTARRKRHEISIDDLRDYEIEQVLAADSRAHKALRFHWKDRNWWFTVRHNGAEVFETGMLEVAIERYNEL